ncbi:MAG: HEAT repeat domain-containing protein [Planctomycetota bacterium]
MRKKYRTPAATACLAASGLLFGGCDMLDNAEGARSIFAAVQPPTPAELAEDMLQDYDPDARATATVQLANAPFGGELPYIAAYVDGASDPDASVRSASIKALSLHGQPEHADILLAALRDEDAGVRLEAARALQRIHNPDVVADLLTSLSEPDALAEEFVGEDDDRVRSAVAHALGQYAEPRVVQGLIAALDDRALAVNESSRESLVVLTGEDFGLDRAAWFGWFEFSTDPFAGRTEYNYPRFARDRTLIEFLPLVPQPPNEPRATPVGMDPRDLTGTPRDNDAG